MHGKAMLVSLASVALVNKLTTVLVKSLTHVACCESFHCGECTCTIFLHNIVGASLNSASHTLSEPLLLAKSATVSRINVPPTRAMAPPTWPPME